LAREARQRQLARMIATINDEKTVFEVRDSPEFKSSVIRLWLLKAAEMAGKDIVVRKSDGGWLVGLSTPERRSRRGRPRKVPNR
jgi:hypothetical protein